MTIGPNSSEPRRQTHSLEEVAESSDDRRHRWAHFLRSQHYEPAIFEVLSDELPKYTTSGVIDPTDIVSHMRECALILASASRIFSAAVEGNLVSGMIRMLTSRQITQLYSSVLITSHRSTPTFSKTKKDKLHHQRST